MKSTTSIMTGAFVVWAFFFTTHVLAAFPDCSNGPLRNETVCDKNLGKAKIKLWLVVSLLIVSRPIDQGDLLNQAFHLGGEAQQHWKRISRRA
jgi:hypothetical protein